MLGDLYGLVLFDIRMSLGFVEQEAQLFGVVKNGSVKKRKEYVSEILSTLFFSEKAPAGAGVNRLWKNRFPGEFSTAEGGIAPLPYVSRSLVSSVKHLPEYKRRPAIVWCINPPEIVIGYVPVYGASNLRRSHLRRVHLID